MITYRDMTFCVNKNCKKRCSKYLTPEIEQAAIESALPISVAEMICLDCGEDGVYKVAEETDA